jgi:biopolymer transport protein ExbB
MKKLLSVLFVVLFMQVNLLAENEVTENSVTTAFKVVKESPWKKSLTVINLKEVFSASPVIYSMMLALSVSSVALWLYVLLSLRPKDVLSKEVVKVVRAQLASKNYKDAYVYCKNNKSLLATMIAAAINARRHGPQYMVEKMEEEGRLSTAHFWQKVNVLSDIAVISPMLGLLGTVLGIFYAFYDITRASADNLLSLFDGLGIAIGTTVGGILVSVMAMIFCTTLKYRLTKLLNLVAKEALALESLIEAE